MQYVLVKMKRVSCGCKVFTLANDTEQLALHSLMPTTPRPWDEKQNQSLETWIGNQKCRACNKSYRMSDNSFRTQLGMANQTACNPLTAATASCFFIWREKTWNHCSVIKYQSVRRPNKIWLKKWPFIVLLVSCSGCFIKWTSCTSRCWWMMGADATCDRRWPELSPALCSWSMGLMVFLTGWWGRSSAGFSSILCQEIRMQPPLSEPRSCLPLSQQPLGRWQGDGWYLQPGCTAPPKHTDTHSLSLVLCLSLTHTLTANKHAHLYTHARALPSRSSLSSYSLLHVHTDSTVFV